MDEQQRFKVVVKDRKGHTETRATGVTLETAEAVKKTLLNFGPFKTVTIMPDDSKKTD